MAAKQHLTAPDPRETKFPKGIPYIVGNEFAERFSFYGMKGILVVFMTTYLLGPNGELVNMSRDEAMSNYHLFTAGAYFFPLIGALIADIYLGKYKTILYLSLLYCVGHGSLALMDVAPEHFGIGMRPFMFFGLVCIAMGAGAIKPCVSAHVGDQFGLGNHHMLTKVFNWFYFCINIGAATSLLLTPILLENYGPWLAFGLPGVLMGIATFLFWMGRNEFVHVPPSGIKKFMEEVLSPEGKRSILNLIPLFMIFVPVFWAIFDQTGSSWVLQTEQMDRVFLKAEAWLPSQVQAVNPVLILIGIPIFTYVLYPLCDKVWKLTPLRKIGIGFLITAGAFALSAVIESWIVAGSGPVIGELWAALAPEAKEGLSMPTKLGDMLQILKDQNWTSAQISPFLTEMPNIAWQFLAYILITGGEIMVSIVCLEFAYTQSPKRMKSFVMGIYFLGVSLGNFYVAGVNKFMDYSRDEAGNTPLDGANYFWFFTALMVATTVVYVVYSQFYKGDTFIQGDEQPGAHAEAGAEGTDVH
ncbi:MAG: POT family proton-dependent oligopeptide transporter [Planctomycetota bacterium]|jgi:POT family proton-dependent oligopeptide transporter